MTAARGLARPPAGAEPVEAAAATGRATGGLVLVATPIGNLADASSRAIAALSEADLVACEDTRRTGMLLRLLGIGARPLLSVHGHNELQRADEVVRRLRSGETVALVSDAGTPAISDPGARLVERVLAEGLTVTAVPGPTAAVTALVVSGLPTERFCFEGFLPRKGTERARRIERIARSEVTSVVYESPARVHATLAELERACGPERPVACARELTKLHEEVWRGTLGDALVAGHEHRGEYVLVVGPGAPASTPARAEVAVAIGRLRAAGLATRDAVAAVELLLGVPHREAYEVALGLDRTGR